MNPVAESATAYKEILFEVKDGVARVTINRPEVAGVAADGNQARKK